MSTAERFNLFLRDGSATAVQIASASRVTFSSGQNSFEFDNIAAGVPEPATWALMILGFGAVGATIRSQRRVFAA